MDAKWLAVVILLIYSKSSKSADNQTVSVQDIYKFWSDQEEMGKTKLLPLKVRKNVTLLLGTTGAGKSTLASFLAGANLEAIFDEDTDSFFLRDADQRISNESASTSFTITPEALVDQHSGQTFIDCPGFGDTRGVIHDISVTFFIRRMFKQIKYVKLLLVVPEYAVRPKSGDRSFFTKFAEQLTKFMQHIDHYHSGVALVVSKVDSSKSDAAVVKATAQFLRDFKHHVDQVGTHRQRDAIFDLVDALLETKKVNGKDIFHRIGVFRMASRSGRLWDDPKLMDEGNYIKSILQNDLSFVRVNESDFDFSISDESITSVRDLIDEVEQRIYVNIEKMFKGIERELSRDEEHLCNVKYGHILQKRIAHVQEVIEKVDSTDPWTFTGQMFNAISTLHIRSVMPEFEAFTTNVDFIDFLMKVSKRRWEIPQKLPVRNDVLEKISNMEEWFVFINSTYNVLRNFHGYGLFIDRVNMPAVLDQHHDLPTTFERSDAIRSLIPASMDLTIPRRRMLRDMLSTLAYRDVRCVSRTEILAKGYNLKISDVVALDCWNDARIIKMYAINTVFVDDNIDKIGMEAQVIIVAPTWNVISSPHEQRRIVLDGAMGGRQAQAATGVEGKAGLPGGPGGFFYGFGSHFVDSARLRISANGGKGGPGQQGGRGKNGISGRDVPKNLNTEFEPPFWLPSSASKVEEMWFNSGFDCHSKLSFLSWDVLAHVSGTKGIPPSNGSNGGKGGLGGAPGDVRIISGRNDISTSIMHGRKGDFGKGGDGGHAAKDGDNMIIEYSYKRAIIGPDGNIKAISHKSEPGGRIGPGQPGLDDYVGAHDQPRVPSSPNVNDFIIGYKTFAGHHLTKNIDGTESERIQTFIHFLDSDTRMRSEALDFVKELQALEQHWFEFSQRDAFLLPFYESLRRRVEHYKQAHPSNALDAVYVATANKLFSMQHPVHYVPIIDLISYKQANEKHIQDLRDATYLTKIYANYAGYELSIYGEIRAANKLIDGAILPQIDSSFAAANNLVIDLVDEVDELKKRVTLDQLQLQAKRNKIKEAMMIAAILDGLRILSIGLMFAGPYGIAASTAINVGIGIAAINSPPNDAKESSKLTQPLERLNDQLEYWNELLKERAQDHKQRLQSQNQTSDLRQINAQIEQLETQIDADLKSNADTPNIGLTIQLYDNQRMEDMLLTNQSDLMANTRKKRSAINAVKDISHIGLGLRKRIKESEDKLQEVDAAIAALGNQLIGLDTYRQIVLDNMFTKLRVIEQSAHTRSNMAGKSQSELDFTEWDNEKWLESIRGEVGRLVGNFSAGNKLLQTLHDIDHAMQIIRKIYGRINDLMRHKQNAKYFANLFASSVPHDANDATAIPLAELKRTIKANLIIEQYNLFVYALQQHKFPFARAYTQIDSNKMELGTANITTIANTVIDQMHSFEEKIKKSDSALNNFDRDIHSNVAFDNVAHPVFYAWKCAEIAPLLAQLFQGNPIILTANIVNGPNQNAIKFRKLHLRFRVHGNNASDASLQDVLRGYKYTITLLGDRFYRCDQRLYAMPTDENVVIDQAFARNAKDNEPIDANDVYRKLSVPSADYFLSPYGELEIQLKPRQGTFRPLYPYKDEAIELELIGDGQYFDSNSELVASTCNEQLDEYYDFYELVDNEETQSFFSSSFATMV